jgi:hypothetical protein
VKPVQHEHAIEVKLSPELQDSIDGIHDHFVEHRRAYVLGSLGGLIVGIVGTRMLSRPVINVTVTPPVN